jgi:hypothetical protein
MLKSFLALHVERPRRRLTALHKPFWLALRTVLVRVEEATSYWLLLEPL